MNAATSEPTNISPSPTPITSGVERRAANDRSGFVGVGEDQREVALQSPQHRQNRGGEVTRGVAAHVLLSLANSASAASSSWRSAVKFSMIPLWTTAILPAASRCGWA